MNARIVPPAISVALLLGVVLLYAPVRDHAFLDYDDAAYVTEQEHVLDGVSAEGLLWALRATEMGGWQPLTWWSYMLDVEIHGLDSAAHHATGVWLHALASALLFLVLWMATGETGRPALAAALFAAHPLRVESVAWVAERKDVLCGVFSFATLAAHIAYAHRPTAWRYAAVVLLFAAALMSKPMAITLPALLLLLDHWPLQRGFGRGAVGGRSRALVIEKLPLFAMSIAAGAGALWGQRAGGAIASLETLGFGARLANGVVSYAAYLRKTLWPSDLAVFYPHPIDGLPLAQVATAGLVIAGLSAVALWARHARPAVVVGWLWYLGTLLPVIGLVQVGQQAMADRYTYLPSVGLVIAVLWALPRSAFRPTAAGAACAAFGYLAVGLLALSTRAQLAHWEDDETLFEHALAVTGGSRVAHLNYGNAIEGQGRRDEQIFHFERAVALAPGDALAHYDLGRVLALEGAHERALAHYRRALELNPGQARTWNNVGNVLAELGDVAGARRSYERALRVTSDHPSALYNLALLLIDAGEYDAALLRGLAFHAQRPGDEGSRLHLARSFALRGRVREALEVLRVANPQPSAEVLALCASLEWAEGVDPLAIELMRRARELDPNSEVIANDLAWMLAVTRVAGSADAAAALVLVEPLAASERGRRDPGLLDTLAAVHAAAGDYDRAVEIAARAMRIAVEAGDDALAAAIRARQGRYAEGRPAPRVSKERGEASTALAPARPSAPTAPSAPSAGKASAGDG